MSPSAPSAESLSAAAQRLAVALERSGQQIVFAESCTAGLVSATLAQVAGVSRWLCGSWVTYQEDSKQQWLGVSAEMLQQFTAVSEPVAIAMAQGALARTAQADLAVSVTGHLGPQAPPDQDGQVFIAIEIRQATEPSGPGKVQFIQLPPGPRLERQQAVAIAVLDVATHWLTEENAFVPTCGNSPSTAGLSATKPTGGADNPQQGVTDRRS